MKRRRPGDLAEQSKRRKRQFGSHAPIRSGKQGSANYDGKLKSQKKHTQDFTSLALFRDDVECLLRDLYGDFESEALDSVVLAVFRIVQQFTHYVRPELWKEHDDAEMFDYILFGREGYGISSSEFHRGMGAKRDLFNRVREVDANQSTVSEYTIEFAKLFAERWDCSKEYVDPLF